MVSKVAIPASGLWPNCNKQESEGTVTYVEDCNNRVWWADRVRARIRRGAVHLYLILNIISDPNCGMPG